MTGRPGRGMFRFTSVGSGGNFTFEGLRAGDYTLSIAGFQLQNSRFHLDQESSSQQVEVRARRIQDSS